MLHPYPHRPQPRPSKRGLILFSVLFLGYATEAVSAQVPLGEESGVTDGRKAKAAQAAPQEARNPWSLTLNGEIVNYVLFQSHAFFGNRAKAWMETSARLGGTLRYQDLTIEVSGLGLKTFGRDPYGSGTAPAHAPAGAPPRGAPPLFSLDKASLQLENVGDLPLILTIGRQYITLGSQFLIGDGVYDGFHARYQQAVFHNPRKGFDAVRLQWKVYETDFDSFLYLVHPTWDGGGKQNGFVGGLDVSHAFAALKGNYAGGLFYRYSDSHADNNMMVLDLRGEQRLPHRPELYASGEFVREFAGTCRNGFYCTRVGQAMNEQSWHVEMGYQASTLPLRPFAEVSYVYYSTDFTPLAPGFSDWGKWYLGNQIDWIIFGTNTKVLRGEMGCWPHDAVKLRLQYYNTRQVTPTGASTGGSLSNELSFIIEWYPTDRFWVNVLVGNSRPGRALGRSGLGNPFALFNSGAAAVGASASLDVVFAFGVRF